MESINVIEATKSLIHNILDVIDRSPWRDTYSERIRVLAERADYPCELAIVGQVKAGKSSFLNALLGEDYALVGTTETTATINFFKYGLPKDPQHPVKVVWDDGKEEWQTREFLDSLQGNSADVLEKAQKIDHLEYYLQNSILQNITLVDTPGTNALVGEHNERATMYIANGGKLREKHHQQSVNLKNKADAVVVITGRVPNMSTSEIVASFSQETSAFNAIGVMTKIDIEDGTTATDWQRRCTEFSAMLRQQLNSIVPVSAQVFRAVKKLDSLGKLEEIASCLRTIPSDEFEEVCKSRETFLGNDSDINEYFSQYGLSYAQRKALAENLDWMVFYKIASELYSNPVEVAKRNLIDYSGMERINGLLEQQFFNRSRIIRCSKIAADLHKMLDEIINRRIYSLRRDANNRQEYLKILSQSSVDEWLKNDFENFIKENICTKDQYQGYENKILDLIQKVENLQQSFGGTDKKSEALLLLEQKQSSFTDLEFEELETLFGKYADKPQPTDRRYIASRQAFWRGRKASTSNNEVKRIIEFAIYSYGTINLK